MSQFAVSSDDPGSLRLLLVEDDEETAVLMRRVFERNPDYASTMDEVRSLQAARTALAATTYDAVLLDLGLPDSEGLRTTQQVLEAASPPTAVVVITAQKDQDLAASSLRLGVQDYIVKDDLTPVFATRVVRYGVTRARLTEELAAARRGEERERELRRLERYAAGGTAAVTGAVAGRQSLPQRVGDHRFDEMVEEYVRILREGMDEQAYRGTHERPSDLRSLAQILGFLGAGPREVVELHARGMRRALLGGEPGRAPAVIEEGRVLVLELMGRLASYYRDRAIRTRSPAPASDGPTDTVASAAESTDDVRDPL